ncbi:MAG TPA: DUF2784 domain-containing protein [Gemmataceae bacterium]|jgi:hypothetical protein|nr:DUF2784 domain-containing protein [Gemmataceae bacterium]
MYGFLADLMVAIHVGYVAYVVLGQLATWMGWALGRRFVRNFWFRSTHLLAIAVVAIEQAFAIRCPLTVWEESFRVKAGQPVSGETFLGRLMHSLLFHDFQPWVFAAIYYTTLAVVALTLFLCPPRWPCRGKSAMKPSVTVTASL